MKLKQVRVDGFRSVKERVKLFIDPKVTILIGANDHGKTTLLEAIRCLNDDKALTAEDENWDSIDQGRPVLEFDFELDEEESKQLMEMADGIAKKEHEKKVAEAASGPVVVTAQATGPSPLPLSLLNPPARAQFLRCLSHRPLFRRWSGITCKSPYLP
jgi:predicted ATP-dependent endonuclease of OLD family